jgi:hypothetical protein
MKTAVRPLVDTDLEGLGRLRTLVHSHRPEAFDTDWQGSIWRWLETHPLAEEMHRWVAATDEGEVVGHLAALPQFYRIGGHRVVAHTPADYQVLPRYGFYALSLMRRFFRTVENCVSCDTEHEVIAVETRLGAKEAGKLQFAAKVWNVAGIPGFPAATPRPILQLLNFGFRGVDGALSSTFLASDLKAVLIDGFDASFDELFESVAAVVPCVAEKDAAFLRWRYGPGSPQASAVLLGVRGGRRLLGYAVLWITRDGGDGYLLDLTARPGRHDVARSLLIEAVRHFRRAGVDSIRYRFIESPTSPRMKDLWRLGFLLGYKRRSTLLVKFADQLLQEVVLDSAHWAYSFGDGEATFWMR